MTLLYYTLLTLLVLVAILLILVILIQKGRGGGLSSAFGGGGGSTAFGAKTGDVLTWATSIIFGVFILLAVLLDLVVGNQYKSTATVPTPPPTSSVPVVPAPVPADNTAPANPAPVAIPTTSAVADQVLQMLKNPTTQAMTGLKATTQP